MTMARVSSLLASILLLAWWSPAGARSAAPPDSVPLFEGLGDHHLEITTDDSLAQRYFDQGLRLVWAFNHAEAIRSFEEAVRRDPGCAMCRWGIAWAHGPNINAPMDSASAVAAHRAVEEARARAGDASPVERALIEAMGERYAATPGTSRAALDSAYARATEAVVERHDLAEGRVLEAEARMVLSPWDYWTTDGEPKAGTERILSLLESVIEENPDHPGACHLYIHAVEAAHPERGLACAERLPELMPAAGHVVHMPAHVYLRVGRYGDAIEANRHAVKADEEYLEDRNPDGLYPDAYYPHNYHFLAFAAAMAGRGEQAIEAARAVAEKTPREIVEGVYFLESVPAYPHLMMVTFGRWDAVLAEPKPPSDLVTAAGLAEYARGVAYAAKGSKEEAEASLGRLARFASLRRAGHPTPAIHELPIAIHALAGEIALRKGDPDEAVLHFRQAAELEDALLYDEPPLWYYPIRHSLGRALLAAGRPVDAEAVYREDLQRFPENGWSLFGLARALEAQGREAEAAEVRERFERAWSGAGVELSASRF